MSITQQLGLLTLLAYLLGSIPFGLVVGKLKGIDPRNAGSKNIGATNVGRLLGGRYFALVFLLDGLKGMIPMLTAAYLLAHVGPNEKPYVLWMGVGAAAILGHLFPLYLRFKGGKGVATSAGVVMGMWPFFTLPGLAAFGVCGVVFAFTRMVSAGSILAAASFPGLYMLAGGYFGWPVFGKQMPMLIFSIVMASLIIFKHRTNVARILAGTENTVGRRKLTPPRA